MFVVHIYQPWPSLTPSVFLQPDQDREEEPAVPGKVSAWWVSPLQCIEVTTLVNWNGWVHYSYHRYPTLATGMGGTAPERSLQGAEKTWQAVQVG